MASPITQPQSELSIAGDSKKKNFLDENQNNVQDPEVPKTEETAAPTPAGNKSPLRCVLIARNTTLPFLIVFGIRFLYLIVVFFLWAANTVFPYLGIGSGFVPPKNSTVWNTLKTNNFSMLAQFFYPYEPHPLLDASKSEYYSYFRGCVAGAYTFEFLLSSPFALYGIYVARKSFRYSKKYTRDWTVGMLIPYLFYTWGAINFFISIDFGMLYYVDLIMIPALVLLMKIRMKWMDAMIKEGHTSTTKSKTLEPETPKLPESTPAEDVKKDPDFKNLFGDNAGDDRPDSVGITSLEPNSSNATFTTESGATMSSMSTVPSTMTDKTATTQDGGKSVRHEDKHVVEKVFTQTTIIAASPTAQHSSKHKDKKHKHKSKHKHKKHKK